jgi:acyl-ACP thioesterase
VELLVPIPASGRTFRTRYRIRLSDMDETGRLRLDAVARFLQDAATDDVEETGWGAPEHLWVIRSVRIEVLEPFVEDRASDVVTWGAASRRSRQAGGGRSRVTQAVRSRSTAPGSTSTGTPAPHA